MSYSLVRKAITKNYDVPRSWRCTSAMFQSCISVLETSKELKMNITVSTNVSQTFSHARISKIIFKSLETPTYKNVRRPGKKWAVRSVRKLLHTTVLLTAC